MYLVTFKTLNFIEIPLKSPVLTSCGCTKDCFKNIFEERRKNLFDGFWKTGSFDIQNTFLCGCVKVTENK